MQNSGITTVYIIQYNSEVGTSFGLPYIWRGRCPTYFALKYVFQSLCLHIWRKFSKYLKNGKLTYKSFNDYMKAIFEVFHAFIIIIYVTLQYN